MRHGRFEVRTWALAGALLAFLIVPGLAEACPMCAEALENQKPGTPDANLSRGFAYSVYFMLPVPFLLMVGFGFLIRNALLQDAAVLADLPTDEPPNAG